MPRRFSPKGIPPKKVTPPQPTYTTPGVYVKQVSVGAPSIEGVATDVTVFVGACGQGPTDSAVRVTSRGDYEQHFGVVQSGHLLGHAVHHFFLNGGREALVVRVDAGAPDPAPSDPAFLAEVVTVAQPGGLLDGIDPFHLVCVPGLTDPATVTVVAALCRRRRAFLILDLPEAASVTDVVAAAGSLGGPDADHAALYHPWLRAPDAVTGQVGVFPPSGFVAGIYARTDAQRGVFKAPAGTGAGVTGAAGPAVDVTHAQQAVLNPAGVNAIRAFPGRGTLVWGARTLAPASEYRYVPLRRFALYLQESLDRGLEWAAIESNGPALWSRVRSAVDAFMLAEWRRGALQGAKPEEAWFVRCDTTTMTPADLAAGRLVLQLGFAPLKPAEFVVLRIERRVASP